MVHVKSRVPNWALGQGREDLSNTRKRPSRRIKKNKSILETHVKETGYIYKKTKQSQNKKITKKT